jgi:hypothetical protein
MDLAELKKAIPDLNGKSHAEKIKLFAWHVHTHDHKSHFQPADIKACYDKLNLIPPQSFGGYLTNLMSANEVLKNASGYRLSGPVRDDFEALYIPTGHKVHVTKLFKDLPAQIPNLAERTYLDEALICYENGAFRGAIVMTWNLAFHHLCDYVLTKKLTEFNSRWQLARPGDHRKRTIVIANMDDINQELKESVFIEICRDAGIVTKDVWKILDQKLGKRNSAAHPSTINIGQLQADDFIDDLVKNVVLRIV